MFKSWAINSNGFEKVTSFLTKMGIFYSTPSYSFPNGKLMNLDYVNESVDTKEFYKLRIYQIMVSSFQASTWFWGGYGTGYGPSHHRGDLDGITNALDYIKSLNVNAIWITPIFDSNYAYKGKQLQSTGYFCNDYFHVDKHFGGDAAFKRLVDACHEKGIYVILDVAFGHNGKVKNPSPSGLKPTDELAKFPESLDYCLEVIQYWTENYNVDGWRLDQCYQLNQDGHNYMHEIKQFFERLCTKRKAEGHEWGTLGYIVGEHWGKADDIREITYKGDGLRSAFDFPARFDLLSAIAQTEDGTKGGMEQLITMFKPLNERGYLEDSIPNMFVGNHDLWRLGNLIREGRNQDQFTDAYWNIHKLAFCLLCAYTGPITLYYGEEIGDITNEWYHQEHHFCGDHVASDNCSRTNGQIKNFNYRQKDLHDFVQMLMQLRRDNPALYRGTDSITIQGNIMINYKYDEETQNKIIVMCNIGDDWETASYKCDHYKLKNLFDPQYKFVQEEDETFKIPVENMTAVYFQIVE